MSQQTEALPEKDEEPDWLRSLKGKTHKVTTGNETPRGTNQWETLLLGKSRGGKWRNAENVGAKNSNHYLVTSASTIEADERPPL